MEDILMNELSFVFDLVRTLASLAVPIVVAILGRKFSERLKAIDQHFWFSQKVIEKRLAVYNGLSEGLNKLFCYFTYVGDWKLMTPKDVIGVKRELDRIMHTHQFIFPKDVFEAYKKFMQALFQMYNGPGEDAKLRTKVRSGDGDRITALQEYRADHAHEFSLKVFDEDRAVEKHEVTGLYIALMASLAASLGVNPEIN
jgi:hypothetical protein